MKTKQRENKKEKAVCMGKKIERKKKKGKKKGN